MFEIKDDVFRNVTHEKNIEYEVLEAINSRTKPNNFNWLRVAAILFAFVAISTVYLLNEYNSELNIEYSQVNNTSEKVETYCLVDGTKVTLSSGSSLKYSAAFNKEKREVELSGEGFFDVKRDESRPFIVTTDDLKTRVLGTSFNINQNNDEIKVTVVSGLVKVFDKNNTVHLKKNQEAVFEKQSKELFKHKVNSAYAIFWFKESQRFAAVSMEEISDLLDKKFGINVVYKDKTLAKVRISTTLKSSDNINVIVDRINNLGEIKLRKTGESTIEVSRAK